MKHLSLLILIIVGSINVNAQFTLFGGGEYSQQTETSSYSDGEITGELIAEFQKLLDEVTDVTVLGRDVNINTSAFDEWANKERVKDITRYTLQAGARFRLDGIEMLGAIKGGVRTVDRENVITTPGFTLRASASMYVNAGLINLLGGDLDPLRMGDIDLNWLEIISVGTTVESVNTKLIQSLDAKAQFEFMKWDQSIILYGKLSHYLGEDITNSFSIGLIYTKSND